MRRVSLRKNHTVIGKPLEIRRKIIVRAGIGAGRDHRQLGAVPPLIVCEDEDDIRPLRKGSGDCQAKQQGGSK